VLKKNKKKKKENEGYLKPKRKEKTNKGFLVYLQAQLNCCFDHPSRTTKKKKKR
jgi:hypothetical protein